MALIIKKMFTNAQISKFFHAALLINATGLLSDIIVYRYFPEWEFMKITNENLGNLSILMVCLVLISQYILIFIEHHKKFVSRHTFIAFTFIVCMSTFFFWFLHADNDIQEGFIIFFSSISRNNHDWKVLTIVFSLFCLILFNFYKLLRKTDKINKETVPQLLSATFYFMLQEYILIFIALFGTFQLQHFRKFAIKILGHGQATITSHLTALQILLPITWISTLAYYFYTHYIKTLNLKNSK